jgi:hypothetical protein
MTTMFRSNYIQSYGDFLLNGIYDVHSRFNKAINFISEDFLISIVTEEIGVGPLNIVVSGFDLNNIRTLIIEEESCMMNGIKYDFEIAKRVDSIIKYDFINIEKFFSNLKVFENCLLDNSPAKSLTFLVDEKRKRNFKTTFEKNFVRTIEYAVRKLDTSTFLEGVKKIKGTGFGFTPSGDDFICGLLLGLNIARRFFQPELTNKINEISIAAKGGNPISNAFLLCAKQGLMFEKFKKLVFSILYLDDKKVIEGTERLCTVGATSGADMGVGFLKGVQLAATSI